MQREWVDCSNCSGEGRYEVDCTDARYEHTTRVETCSVCLGARGGMYLADEGELDEEDMGVERSVA